MARPRSLGLVESGGANPAAGPPPDAAGPLGFWLKNTEFMSRRAHALAEYCTALAQVRGPEETMAIHARFWNRLMEDYAAWTVEAATPFALGPASLSSAFPTSSSQPAVADAGPGPQRPRPA